MNSKERLILTIDEIIEYLKILKRDIEKSNLDDEMCEELICEFEDIYDRIYELGDYIY